MREETTVTTNQVAAQLYSIRDHLRTRREVAKSLARVRAIGYQGVELAGLGPVADAELRTILEGEGLAAVACHVPGNSLFGKIDDVIGMLKTVGCTTAVYPYPAGVPMQTAFQIGEFAGKLQAAGTALAAAGISLLYHNHNMELRRIDGALVLDMIFAQTSPRFLAAELDTYWIQAGGGDPVAWCRKLKGRLPILHMKDYGVQDEWESIPASVYKEIGKGNLNWTEILAAAEESGCRVFIVEQDANWIGGDPFESLRISFEFIRESLCL